MATRAASKQTKAQPSLRVADAREIRGPVGGIVLHDDEASTFTMVAWRDCRLASMWGKTCVRAGLRNSHGMIAAQR